jgi:hypothetical protein
MLHSIKQTAVQIATVAVLTAGAAVGPSATSAFAAPAGVGTDRAQSERTWYMIPADQDGCQSSPASLNHTFCKDAGGGN